MFKRVKNIIDFKLVKYLFIFHSFFPVINFLRLGYFKVFNPISNIDRSWFQLFFEYVLINVVIVSILIVIIIVIATYLINNKTKRIWLIITFLIMGILANVYHTSLYFILQYFFDRINLESITIKTFVDQSFAYLYMDSVRYISFIAIIYLYYNFKKIKNIELQKSQMQAQIVETKLNALRSQLHPHFMFNTLNSISSLIDKDGKKAQDLIADFGDLFRVIMDSKDDDVITLKKELNVLDKYLDIISIRFSDHLKVNKNIAKDTENYLVPNMLIQPIVENAIKHGYSYDITDLTININVFKQDEFLHIKVENNGAALTSDFETLINKGSGLKITNQRLKTLYKDNYTFSLQNKKDTGTIEVFTKIPLSL